MKQNRRRNKKREKDERKENRHRGERRMWITEPSEMQERKTIKERRKR